MTGGMSANPHYRTFGAKGADIDGVGHFPRIYLLIDVQF